ncbi:MAG TPA: 30S ribosome-binding factor RbfA [Edaphobacter sp.]|nr:30S ribosome-binding factor RbfA [Edaphobacter sp.]
MESRGQQHHRERLVEAFREELSTILAGELGDPRIGLVTITDLVYNEGGKSVRVFVSVTGDDKEAKQTIDGLKAASGYIRHELAENLGLRHAPELLWTLDRSEHVKGRIDELLHRIEKRNKKGKNDQGL